MWKTDNRFADYLMNDHNVELYSMWDADNISAFLDFYFNPLTLTDADGQTSLADVRSTLYRKEKGKCVKLPCAELPDWDRVLRDRIYTPADLVYGDIFSGVNYFADRFSWCLPGTVQTLGDFKIKLVTRQYNFSFRLRTYGDGFVKYAQSWESDLPAFPDWLVIPGDEEQSEKP